LRTGGGRTNPPHFAKKNLVVRSEADSGSDSPARPTAHREKGSDQHRQMARSLGNEPVDHSYPTKHHFLISRPSSASSRSMWCTAAGSGAAPAQAHPPPCPALVTPRHPVDEDIASLRRDPPTRWERCGRRWREMCSRRWTRCPKRGERAPRSGAQAAACGACVMLAAASLTGDMSVGIVA
jgi:hypothetical protein